MSIKSPHHGFPLPWGRDDKNCSLDMGASGQAALSAPSPPDTKPWAAFHRSCFPVLCPLSPSGQGGSCHSPALQGWRHRLVSNRLVSNHLMSNHLTPLVLMLCLSACAQWELTAARAPQPWPSHLRALLVFSQRIDSHFDCPAGHSLTSASPVRSPSVDTCWLAQQPASREPMAGKCEQIQPRIVFHPDPL